MGNHHVTEVRTCFLFLVGITGIYARQVQHSGWFGLLGYLVFSLSCAIQFGFVSVEAFVLPVLATAAPAFVASYLGVVNGPPNRDEISGNFRKCWLAARARIVRE